MVAQRLQIGVLQEFHRADAHDIGRNDVNDGREYLPAAAQLPHGVDGDTSHQQIDQHKVHLVAHQKPQQQGQRYRGDKAGAGIEQDGKGHGYHGNGYHVFRCIKPMIEQVAQGQDPDKEQVDQQKDTILPVPGPAVYVEPEVEEGQQDHGDQEHADARKPELDAPGGGDGLRFGRGEGVELLQHLGCHPGMGIDNQLIFEDEAFGNGHLVHGGLLATKCRLGVIYQVRAEEEVDQQVGAHGPLHCRPGGVLRLQAGLGPRPRLFTVREKGGVRRGLHPLAGQGYGYLLQPLLGQVQNPFGQDVPNNCFQLRLEAPVVDGLAGLRLPLEKSAPVGGIQVQSAKALRKVAAQVHQLCAVPLHRLLDLREAFVVAEAVGLLAAPGQLSLGPLNAPHPGE